MISKDYDLILKESINNFIEEECLRPIRCTNHACKRFFNFRKSETTKEYSIEREMSMYAFGAGEYIKLVENRYIKCPYCNYVNYLTSATVYNQWTPHLEVYELERELKQKYNIK
jgi:hypothetical protein